MKTPMQKLCAAALVAAALTAGAVGVNAQTTNLIDVQMFGSPYQGGPSGTVQTGAAVLGTNGDIWNQINPGFPDGGPNIVAGAALVNVSSNSVPATFTYNGVTATYGGDLANTNGINPATGTATNGNATASVGTKSLYSGSTVEFTPGNTGTLSQTFSFNNLSSFIGDTFILDIYAASAQSFTLSGATGGNSSSTLAATATDANINNGAGDAYVQYTGTITGSTLTIGDSWSGGAWGGAVNGFQLQPVAAPEPGTVALAAVGGLALVLAYRRRLSA